MFKAAIQPLGTKSGISVGFSSVQFHFQNSWGPFTQEDIQMMISLQRIEEELNASVSKWAKESFSKLKKKQQIIYIYMCMGVHIYFYMCMYMCADYTYIYIYIYARIHGRTVLAFNIGLLGLLEISITFIWK